MAPSETPAHQDGRHDRLVGDDDRQHLAGLPAVEVPVRIEVDPIRWTAVRPLRDRDAIAAYINTRYGTIDQEVFGVLYLSLDFHWLDDREMFRGAMTRTTAEPRAILRHGSRLGATHFVLFHTPSQRIGDAE